MAAFRNIFLPSPPEVVTPAFSESPPPSVFRKPFPITQQQFEGFAPLGFISGPNHPDGWMFHCPPAFTKPFPVTQQQVEGFGPAGRIISITPQGWWGQSPVLFWKGFPVAKQQVSTTSLQTIPNFTTGWWGQRPDLFLKGFPVTQQQVTGFTPSGDLTSTPQGWWGKSPDLFLKGFPVHLQQVEGFASTTPPVVVQTVYAFSQLPDLFTKPFPVVNQQFSSPNVPNQQPSFFAGSGFQSDVFIDQHIVMETEFYAPQPITVVVSIFNAFSESPALRTKPFPVHLQQASSWVANRDIFVTAPPGWMNQSPAIFRRGVPVTLQQHSAYNSRGNIPTVDFGAGWMGQSPALFMKPPPITSVVMFSEWTPTLVVSVTPTGRVPYSYITSSYIQ